MAVTGCDRVFGLDRGDPPDPPPPEWTAIVAGAAHSCGLHNDHTLWCWGENGTGQIALQPPTLEALSPVQIGEGRWTALATGSFHTCAISEGAELWCWGSNLNNAIGVDTFANPLPLTKVLDDVIAVAAGAEHTCAVRRDNTLWCWGRNTEGELALDPGIIVTTPRDVGGGRMWKTIAAGGYTTCGITTDDELLCWGDNEHAQVVSPPTSAPYSTPELIEPGTEWTDVSVGSLHTCAVRGDGTLRCSGFNGFGQLGSAASNTTVTISTGEPGRTWTRVFAGFQQTCALRDDATLWCFGANAQAQLAIDSGEPTVVIPTYVPGGGETWTQIAVGDGHLCGIDETGVLWCAGTNGAGQLGDGTGGSRLTPTRVAGDWVTSAIGSSSMCARSFPDGSLSCWGQNSSAQLGDGTPFARETPARITSGKPNDPFAVGPAHACSTRSAIDNTLTCWGSNDRGELGTGVAGPPLNLPQATNPAITNAVEVATGTHTCARSSNGDLQCWGWNTQGQLGVAGDNLVHPMPAYLGSQCLSIAAGLFHTCGVFAGGNVYCWGDNTFLQRGTTQMPGKAFVTAGAKTVVLGGYHSCLISSPTDELRCWGANTDGQLGDGTTSNRAAPTPITGSWQVVSAGTTHTCGKQFDGSLWCWGNNARGQLGDGTRTRHLAPTQVGMDTDWSHVAAGGDETCAIKADHSLWCWGANGSGQIGDGTAWSSTFVRIAP